MFRFIFIAATLVLQVSAFYKYGKMPSFANNKEMKNQEMYLKNARGCKNAEDCGEEVCITDFINAGNATGAQESTRVSDLFPGDVDSYAGFAEVNVTAGNKLFWWYVPALDKNPDAPLLVWLQGGPGSSSLFGMFAEMGPFVVDSDFTTLEPRAATWNTHYGMIFIDNPVGAGYSYTTTEDGYCTNTKEQASSQLYELLQQFYQVFPGQQKVDFYITGESYAGHYVPGFAYKIHEQNALVANGDSSNIMVPMVGLAIGDGWVDPYSQLAGYPDMIYDIGMCDNNEKAVFQTYVDLSRGFIEKGQMYESFEVWDQMINGDIFPYPNYFHNVTGSNDYDNFMDCQEPAELDYYYPFVTSDTTRAKIHAGSVPYGTNAADCETHLMSDFMVSFKEETEILMENYKVMIYSGQLDVIIGAALTQRMLATFNWDGKTDFAKAPKSVWRVDSSDTEVAGYVKQAGLFTHAIVRGAGHLVPYDQPERTLDLITKWIENQEFASVVNPVRRPVTVASDVL